MVRNDPGFGCNYVYLKTIICHLLGFLYYEILFYRYIFLTCVPRNLTRSTRLTSSVILAVIRSQEKNVPLMTSQPIISQ